MKRIALILGVLAFLLAGCDDFDKNTYAILYSAETLHVTVHNAALEAKQKGLITHEQAIELADALDLYQSTFLTLKVLYESYLTATGDMKTDFKNQIRHGLTILGEDQERLHKVYSRNLQGLDGVGTWEELK